MGRSIVGAEEGILARYLLLLSALASRLIEGTLTFIDGIRGFRGFGGLRTVPALWRSQEPERGDDNFGHIVLPALAILVIP
jgi:hypothetical protein